MGRMFKQEDYNDLKKYLLKIDESSPMYKTMSDVACLMEVLSEMSVFDASSGIPTALSIVFNEEEQDFIYGFLSHLHESRKIQKEEAAFNAGANMAEYPDGGRDRDSFNADEDDDCDEFGEWPL